VCVCVYECVCVYVCAFVDACVYTGVYECCVYLCVYIIIIHFTNYTLHSTLYTLHYNLQTTNYTLLTTLPGVDYSFECVGNVNLMRNALECTHKGWGQV
jgi:hypothetical protein